MTEALSPHEASLVASVSPMLAALARRFASRSKARLDEGEYLGAAHDAVVRAVKRFDEGRAAFAPYAYAAARGAMLERDRVEAKGRAVLKLTRHVLTGERAFGCVLQDELEGSTSEETDDGALAPRGLDLELGFASDDELRARALRIATGLATAMAVSYLAGHHAAPDASLAERELWGHYERAKEALAERDRRLVELHLEDELTWDQVASTLGVSSPTAKRHTRAAIERLTDELRARAARAGATP